MTDTTKKDDGGAAFPPNAGWRDYDPNARGMSLRDWFAGQALTGLVAAYTEVSWHALAKDAYAIADAMLAQRNKP